jgi:cytochrome b
VTPVRPPPPRSGPLGALLLAAVLVALVALGVAGLVGWGTPVPPPAIPQAVALPPAIPPPPVAPAPR